MKKNAFAPLPETMNIADDPLIMDIINEINTPDDADFEAIKALMKEMIAERLEKA